MSTRVLLAAAAAATLVLGLAPGAALANKPVFNVSGTVTAVPIGHKITVNGHTYRIEAHSAAERQISDIVRGDKVRVVLNGPADASSTRAVAIHAARGR